MKENKEIKKNEELENVSEAQETEQQEQQAEAPKEEQKQEEKKDEPEKAKESIWSKIGKYAKAGAQKVGAGIKKAAPVVVIGTIVGGACYFKGQADAYNNMLGDDGNGEDNPELPGSTEEPAPEIEDAEFTEITADESQSE